MKVSYFIEEIRDRLDDEEEPLLWTDKSIVRALNTVLREYGVRNPIHDESRCYEIATQLDTDRYSYPEDVMTVERVYWRNVLEDDPIGLHKVLEFSCRTGLPAEYRETPARELYIHPSPDNGTLLLRVSRLPFADYSHERLDEDIFEPEYTEALIQGTMGVLYDKRDSDTFNVRSSELAWARFTQLVGQPVDARTLEARRMNANLRFISSAYPYIPQRSWTSWPRPCS